MTERVGPWRYRCPKGHCSYEPRVSGGIYCRKCDEAYPEAVDAMAVDGFPVGGDV